MRRLSESVLFIKILIRNSEVHRATTSAEIKKQRGTTRYIDARVAIPLRKKGTTLQLVLPYSQIPPVVARASRGHEKVRAPWHTLARSVGRVRAEDPISAMSSLRLF